MWYSHVTLAEPVRRGQAKGKWGIFINSVNILICEKFHCAYMSHILLSDNAAVFYLMFMSLQLRLRIAGLMIKTILLMFFHRFPPSKTSSTTPGVYTFAKWTSENHLGCGCVSTQAWLFPIVDAQPGKAQGLASIVYSLPTEPSTC